ncbi:MAG: mersacidin family lantibiotic [Alicyclobacillaceae bacterium]|nr:mersacidin family lantibiotic [Alicyclobacillaceae bacterium]
MEKEQVIRAWKNPSYRAAWGAPIAHPAGEVLAGLDDDELARIYGGGDVQAETTPICAISATVAASSAACAGVGAGISVGVTIVLTIKRC